MKPQVSYQKLRGGYYTPLPIAKFLSSWAVRSARDRVLEPSCGDGVFIEAVAERLTQLGARRSNVPGQIVAYEIDASEAERAQQRLSRLTVQDRRSVHHGDFFWNAAAWNGHGKFDAAVGNPPFIRYQQFPEKQRKLAFQLMRREGLRPNRLTNAWVPFVVAAAALLAPGGRLAMVAPAELLQVNYAAELRLFLTEYFGQLRVITFRGLAFPGIQQEVILLLGTRGPSVERGIEMIELDDASDLVGHTLGEFGSKGLKSVDHGKEKWTQYYLSQEEINLLRLLRTDDRLTVFGAVADTDIGIVTGMNDVFALTAEEVSRWGLIPYARRLVSRSAQLAGIMFNEQDWARNVKTGSKTFLLEIPPVEIDELPKNLVAYLKTAEGSGLHLGYKCRIRKHWYAVPSIYVPDAFMLRQIHHFPKLVTNEGRATCTDTVHRVRFKSKLNQRTVAAAFLNSLTFAFSEILGRSYGGGVLELEPREADLLPVPISQAHRLNARAIDEHVRSSPIEVILDTNDRLLLTEGLGLKEKQVRMLRSIWMRLQQRRIGRRNGNG